VQLGDPAVGADGVGGEQPVPGLGEVSGVVDVTQLLGGDPRRPHLPGGVAGEQPGVAAQRVALGAAQQHPPDPVKGATAPAPVPQGVLLDAAADRVDGVLPSLIV